MRPWLTRASRLVASALLLSQACSAQSPPDQAAADSAILRRLTMEHKCTAHTVRVFSDVVQTNLTEHDRCTLISAAWDYVAHGGARRAGVFASDTAAFTAVGIAAFAFTTMSGKPADRYWTVEFQMPERPYALVVRIDRRTGSITAGRGHPLRQPSAKR